MTKKELKTVNLDDLQSSSPSESSINSTDFIEDVDVKISIADIDKNKPKPKVSVKVNSINKSESKIDKSILKSPRFKKYEGNGSQKSILNFMTSKYSYDKKDVNYLSVIVLSLSIAFYCLAYFVQNFDSGDNIYIAAFVDSAKYALDTIFSPYRKLYVFIIFILFYFFPIKKFTFRMVQVFYDGLTVPVELFPNGMPRRVRLEWRDIYGIEAKKTKDIPYIVLLNQRKSPIGYLRLDVDDLSGFYDKLDTYVPPEHPLRNMLNNLKKN